MKDKYDIEIERLSKFPGLISGHWLRGEPLFQICSTEEMKRNHNTGCLTMIRRNEAFFVLNKDGTKNYELTSAIRSDNRIPEDPNDITIESLSIFAEWQRRLDEEIRT